MEDELHHRVPEGDIKESQADDGKAHDAARGEGDAQTAVEALLRGGGRAAVGACGNRHADEAGKAGEKAAGHKGEGHEPGDKPGRRHAAEAPVRMARDIFCISGVPSEKARTFLLCSHANISAITLAARLTQYKFSIIVYYSYL